MNKYFSFILNPKIILALFLLVSVAVSIQSLNQKGKTFTEGGKEYTSYNNYQIFKYSFFHLKDGKDLYKPYPEEHWDLYKYSPAFAMFFGVFAKLPDIVGLNLWNIFNALILLISIYYLPKIDIKIKSIILLTVLLELKISMQMEQSNALIAGLIILTLGLLERDKYILAAFCIVSAIYIKLFGIVALALFIFYPKKGELALYTILWSLFFLLIPLLVINVNQLKLLYSSWANLLTNDYTSSTGISIIGMLSSWFHVDINKMLILILGVIIFCLPFLKFKNYKNYNFRLLALVSILIWVVIFNHKAESSGYIIAMSGIAIWFYTQKVRTENLIIFIIAFILISISPTGIFPKILNDEFVRPYVLIAVPAIIIWLKVIYDMSLKRKLFTHSQL